MGAIQDGTRTESYPADPTTPAEALQTLAAFARTAPGRLPGRVEEALRIADAEAKRPPDPDGSYRDVTIAYLLARRALYVGGGMKLERFDREFLSGLGEYERRVAEEEGIDLDVGGRPPEPERTS